MSEARSGIRVVIATRTLVPMVADILRVAIAAEPDMTLRTTDAVPEALAADRALDDADVLVMGGAPPAAAAAQRRLAYAHPRTGVLVIGADARSAEMLVLRPQYTRMSAVAPREIIAAIRSAASEPAAGPE
jgi:hypothetical protein